MKRHGNALSRVKAVFLLLTVGTLFVSGVCAADVQFCNTGWEAGELITSPVFLKMQQIINRAGGGPLGIQGMHILEDDGDSLELTKDILEDYISNMYYIDQTEAERINETGFVFDYSQGDRHRYYKILPGLSDFEEIIIGDPEQPSAIPDLPVKGEPMKDLTYFSDFGIQTTEHSSSNFNPVNSFSGVTGFRTSDSFATLKEASPFIQAF